jgi:hypothetical protein
MGGGDSKEESDGKKEEVTVTDTSTKITENSSGFHLIEVHMPSMGMGLSAVLIGLAIYMAWRWRRKKEEAKRELRAVVLTGQGGGHWDPYNGRAITRGCSYHRAGMPLLPFNTRMAPERFEELSPRGLEAGYGMSRMPMPHRGLPGQAYVPEEAEDGGLSDEPAMARR